MPRSTNDERDKLDKTRRKLRRLRGDVKAWVGTAPANNNQRDKRIDDLANAVLALTQRLNLLEGTTDADDLVDPGV